MNNYEISISALQEAKKKKKFLRCLEETQLSHPVCRNLNLESLLITPIQRLPRYVLLLNQMIEKTSETSEDYEHLISSKNYFQNLLDFFNESKRRKELLDESSKKLQSLKKNVYGLPKEILSTEKTFIAEGIVNFSIDDKSEIITYMYLFCDSILIAKPKKGIAQVKKLKAFKFSLTEIVWLNDLNIESSKDDNNTFMAEVKNQPELTTGKLNLRRGQILKFRFDQAEDKDKWLNKLNENKSREERFLNLSQSVKF